MRSDRRLFKSVTIGTLACLLHLAANGPLWAQLIEQDRQQRTMMREYYENLLGKDVAPQQAAGVERVEGVQRSLEQLLLKLAKAQAMPVESRFSPGNYAPTWSAIRHLHQSIDRLVDQLDKQRQRLERDGFSPEVVERHRQAAAAVTERLAAPLDVIDDLDRALELARFDQVEALAQELRQAILDQEPRRPAAEPLASHSGVSPQTSFDSRASTKQAPAPPTAQDLELTPETAVTSEMAALAVDLDHDPARLYAWVRNTIDIVPTYGLVQGAGETLASGRGNPVDQAALLIGLLRGSGVPARYVHGTVEIPAAKVAAWVGTADVDSAVELLSRNGVAVDVQASGGEIGAVRMTHTWVRAWVRYAPYRGLKSGTGDRWIDLDPAFKAVTVKTQKDVATEIGVDPVNFLRQIKSQSTIDDAESWVTQLPEDFIVHSIDLWGGDVERYAAANGLTTENLYGSRSVVEEDLKILPLSLPYQVVSELSSGPAPMAGLETTVELRLTDLDGAALIAYSSTVDQLAGRRLTLRFSPQTQADQDVLVAFRDDPEFPVYLVSLVPSLLVDGVEIATGQPIGMGETLDLEVTLDGPLFANERSHSPVVAGAYAALAFDLQGITRRTLYQHLGPLRQAAEELAAGSTGDVDAVLGEALHTIGLSYWHQLDGLNQLAGGGLGVVVNRQPSQLVAAYEPVITRLLGVPFAATGNRATLAVGGDRITALPTTGSEAAERQLHLVSTLTGSVLQHSILEQTLGGEGVSTIRLLQAASKAGTRVYTFDRGNVGDVETALAALNPALAATVSNTVHAGYQVTVAAEPAAHGGFQGVGWSAFDPVTGSAGTYIDRSQAAGMRLLDALAPAELLLGAEPAAYLPLVAPGIEWIELATSIIEQSGLRYVPAVASIGQWFADSDELDNAAFLAAGIALSGPISLIASRPVIGGVTVTPEVFSPNGDGVKDTVTIRAGLSRESLWQVQIIDDSQVVVASFNGQGQEIDLSWDGTSGGSPVAENRYTVKIDATAVGLDTPAFPEERVVILDLTPPTTGILTPAEGDTIKGVVSIVGTADDANFASYTLEVGEGTSPATWTTIRHGIALIIDSSLGLWNGTEHPNGPYTFRLQAEDRGGNRATTLRQVTLDDPENDLEAPVVILQSPAEGAVVDGPFTIRAEATDNQEVDRVTLAIDGKPVAEFYDPSPDELYEVEVDSVTLSNGAHEISVAAVDARGNEGTGNVSITTGNPVASFTASPNPFSPNGDGIEDTTSLSATLDPADDWTLEISGASGALRAFTGTGSAVLRSWDGRDEAGTMQSTGEYTAVLTTTGGASASLPITLELTNRPPHIEITSPKLGERVQIEVGVVGTVTDTDLDHWTLEYRRLNSEEATLIGQGSHRVLGGVLGRFDPTNLKNDPYELILTAFDTQGQGVQITHRVYAAGMLKIGNLRFTQEDMTLPIEGLPVTVARTYDSLSRHQLGDFGYGWTLSYNSVELDDGTIYQEAEIADGSGQPIMARAGGDRSVTVTLPNGRRTTFSPVFLYGGLFGQVIHWQAEPGVHDKLSITGDVSHSTIITLAGMPPYWYHGTVDEGYEYYDAPGYVLTTKEEILYYLEKPLLAERIPLVFPDGSARNVSKVFGKPKLTRIVDRNGNCIRITEDGITHSNGPEITIVRDPVTHLITAIQDPAGRQVTYSYDNDLNLVGVTDGENNTTSFVYNDDHHLIEMITADGIKPITYNLDDRGRIIGMTDADGNTINITHNTSQRQEVTHDRLGNPTIYTYNDFGYISSETNALGQTTRYEYDHHGNKTKEINPLGETTTFTFDDQGNMLSEEVHLPSSGKVLSRTWTYNSRSQVLSMTDPLGHTTSNTYDENGYLIKTTDALGNVTSYSYDSRGKKTSETDPQANVTTFSYDSRGYKTSVTDPLGNITSYGYDQSGNRISETTTRTTPSGTVTDTTTYVYDGANRKIETIDPYGGSIKTEYNPQGKESALIDELGNRTEYYYDDTGQLILTKYPDGTEESNTYDAEGRKITTTGRDGQTTAYQYDATGQPVKITFADGSMGRSEYDGAGRAVRVIDQLGNVTTLDYDEAGRLTTVTDVSGALQDIEYDDNSRETRISRQNSFSLHHSYDANGNKVKTTNADGSFTSLEYDELGRKIAETDQAGNTTRFSYDSNGRLLKVLDALGYETSYGYDEVGNLVSHTDANHNTTFFEYDSLGRLTKRTLPLGMYETLTYDAKNLVSRTDFNGITTTYEYDESNRLQRRVFPDGSAEEVTYTGLGKLATATDSRGTITYEYDERGRLTRRTEPDGTAVSYTYDDVGNKTAMTTPSGTTKYSYDILNRLATVVDPEGGVSSYSYDEAGNRSTLTYPNGTVARYMYDNLNRLIGLVNQNSNGDIISSYSYSLGPAGNRLQIVEGNGRVVDYAYDATFKLVAERINEPGSTERLIEYSYDPVGNRLEKTDNGEITVYTYDANDRLLSENGISFSYDNNGNTLQKSNGSETTTYSYSYHDKLISAELISNGQSSTLEYVYDYKGNRVQRIVNGAEVTRFTLDTNTEYARVLEERDDTGSVLVSYVYGDDLISQNRGGVASYYHFDGHMSTSSLTDSLGIVTDIYSYDAFGNMLNKVGTTVNHYLYSGEQYDANTGFYYLRARHYDPWKGRFQTSDSWLGNIFDPPSLHKYQYCNADPVNKTDPSGHMTTELMVGLTILAMLCSMMAVINVLVNFFMKPKGSDSFKWEGGMIVLQYGFGLPVASVGLFLLQLKGVTKPSRIARVVAIMFGIAIGFPFAFVGYSVNFTSPERKAFFGPFGGPAHYFSLAGVEPLTPLLMDAPPLGITDMRLGSAKYTGGKVGGRNGSEVGVGFDVGYDALFGVSFGKVWG